MLEQKYSCVVESEISQEAQFLLQMYVNEQFPDNMRAMFTKHKASVWVPKRKAMEAAWVQMHLHDRWCVMVDFDGLDEFHWRKLPLTPNIVCFNPKNGNHQCYWILKVPVHCQSSSKGNKPYKYLRLLEKAIDEAYSGDKGFSRCISKNLFHEQWETDWIHDRRHTLEEIHRGLNLDLRNVGYVTPVASTAKTKKAKKANGKRNKTIFDNVRHRGYKEVAKYKEIDNITYADWLLTVTEWCHRENNWTDAAPLESSEIEATAKQIAHFCWYVYRPRRKRMSIEETKAMQSRAAHATNAKQVASTTEEIIKAIKQLKKDGKKPTKTAVASIVSISRQQISTRYGHLF